MFWLVLVISVHEVCCGFKASMSYTVSSRAA